MMNRRRFLQLTLGAAALAAAGRPLQAAKSAAASTATLAASTARRLPPNGLFGIDGRLVSSSHPWTNAEGLLSVLQASGISWLRYPGRQVADAWDWQSGWLDPNPALGLYLSPALKSLQAVSGRSYPLADLQAPACQTVFTASMAVRNLRLHNQPQLSPLAAAQPALLHCIEALAEAKRNAIDLQWVELGEGFTTVEFWHNKLGQKLFGNDAQNHTAYPEVAAYWSQALRQAHPGARIAFHGASFNAPTGQPVLDQWNSHAWDTFGQAAPLDAMAVQFFLPATLGITTTGDDWGTEAEQTAQHQAIQDPAVLANLFRAADQLLEQFLTEGVGKGLRQTPFQLVISAFNLLDPIGALRHTWAHALAVASLLNAFLREPRVALALLHNAADMPHGALLLTASQFAGLQLPAPAVDPMRLIASLQPYALAPAGRVMQVFQACTTGMQSVQALQPVDSARETVWGLLFSDGGLRSNLLLANFTHLPVVLNSAPLFQGAPYRPADFTLESWQAGPAQYITQLTSAVYPEYACAVSHQTIAAGGQILLPPYSLSRAMQLVPHPDDLRQLHLPIISNWRAP